MKIFKITIMLILLNIISGFAQNIGINTITPQAPLDVNGAAIFRGINSNNLNTILAAVEYFVGRSTEGNMPPGLSKADIAFNWGGIDGGFRHYISTRHTAGLNSEFNSLSFYINNSNIANSPLVEDDPTFSITAVGNKIRRNNFLEFGAGIAKETNAGKIGYQLYSNSLDIVGAGTLPSNRRITFYNEGAANFTGRVGIGTTNIPTESFYVLGTAKIDGNTNLVGNTTLQGDASITGSATVNGDISVQGTVNAGYTYQTADYTLDGNQRASAILTCPSGTYIISGGGGHRDSNAAAWDITVNYTGPDPANPTTKWRVLFSNSSGSSRVVRVYCTCARVQ